MIHIPYKGSMAGVNAVLAGDVDMTIGAAVSVAPHVNAGKLRALATAAPKRLSTAPDVPTLLQLGYPKLHVSDWQGIVAPAATPAKVIYRLHAEIERTLHSVDTQQRLETLGMEAAGAGPKEFAAHIQHEMQRWGTNRDAMRVSRPNELQERSGDRLAPISCLASAWRTPSTSRRAARACRQYGRWFKEQRRTGGSLGYARSLASPRLTRTRQCRPMHGR